MKYREYNPHSEPTEEQKAELHDLIDKRTQEPVYTHTGRITEDDFSSMTRTSGSLFGMLHFYMNNIEKFLERDLFVQLTKSQDTILWSFQPGSRVRPYWVTDGSVYVLIDDKVDDYHETNCFLVNADGSIEGPNMYDLYDCELVLDKSYSKTADFLGEIIFENWENGWLVTIEDVARMSNRQRKYIIELMQKEFSNTESFLIYSGKTEPVFHKTQCINWQNISNFEFI